MTAIEIKALTKRYGALTAVDGLDLAIEEGEIFALLGVNGAGKTTTVKMLSCLTMPTEGDALVCGHSILTEPDKVKRVIDISMQETGVARGLTVEENIAFYCALRGQSRAEAEKTRERLFEQFGFAPVARQKAKTLSGGWQRKLSIALALASSPRVLFLDEPTLGLDVLARRELWRVVETLKGKMTVILTTHYMEEAAALADRVGVMKDGKLLAVGSCAQLYEKTGKQNLEDAFIAIVEGGNAQ